MKLKYFIFVMLLTCLFSADSYSQNVERPKLVVGIVVDQMRFDYLYKFNEFYGNEGFNNLTGGGTNFTFAHFNYVPTQTGPGHTSVYTGTTPYFHGIIANDWYDKKLQKSNYCVSDYSYKSVGSNDDEGCKSPDKLLVTTITDQLKLATGGASKVISISLKDRSSILPGGHLADAAYWYDNVTGDFITSEYYMKSLPDWVNKFNGRKLAEKYLSQDWILSLPVSDYAICSPDESPYENDVFYEGKTSFPHSFKNVDKNKKYEAIETSPFGNDLVKEMAITALKNEELGKHKNTDFLAISFSSTDLVGHAYGTNSYEIEDTYVKLDAQLAELIKALDDQVGKGNYLLFLTADHGAEETPGFLKQSRLPVGELRSDSFFESLKAFAAKTFKDENIIDNVSNNQVFLDRGLLKKRNLNLTEVTKKIVGFMRDTFDPIASIYTRDDFENQTAERTTTNLTLNGFNKTRSGDIAFTLQPGYLMNFMEKGTTHGSSYTYDTHVPVIFYGWHVPKQTINKPVYIIDIAPTISDLLKITEPSGCIGIPIIK